MVSHTTDLELNNVKCSLCYDTGSVTYGGVIGFDEEGDPEYDSWEEPCDCKVGQAVWNNNHKEEKSNV